MNKVGCVPIFFLHSKIGKVLYDVDTRIWCNGPPYIAKMYMTEMSKNIISEYKKQKKCVVEYLVHYTLMLFLLRIMFIQQ